VCPTESTGRRHRQDREQRACQSAASGTSVGGLTASAGSCHPGCLDCI
jgi:hypothetical protein